jgi:hypothetical protein
MERQYDGSLYHWNGVLLHVAISTPVDIYYAIMRIAGYIAATNALIFEGLVHTIVYIFHYRHIPIVYPRRPLNRKYLALHWGKGTVGFLPPDYGTTMLGTSVIVARSLRIFPSQ